MVAQAVLLAEVDAAGVGVPGPWTWVEDVVRFPRLWVGAAAVILLLGGGRDFRRQSLELLVPRVAPDLAPTRIPWPRASGMGHVLGLQRLALSAAPGEGHAPTTLVWLLAWTLSFL